MDYKEKIKKELTEIREIAKDPLAFADRMGFQGTAAYKRTAALNWQVQAVKQVEMYVDLLEVAVRGQVFQGLADKASAELDKILAEVV